MTNRLLTTTALIALTFTVEPRAGLTESCGPWDRGRLIQHEQVASYATAASVRAYFDEWIAFYQDFYGFPAALPATFSYGFDSYKVTYCTVDAVLHQALADIAPPAERGAA